MPLDEARKPQAARLLDPLCVRPGQPGSCSPQPDLTPIEVVFPGAVRGTSLLARHSVQNHGVVQVDHLASLLGDDLAQVERRPVATPAVPEHLQLEEETPVLSLRGESGLDLIPALDLHQFARFQSKRLPAGDFAIGPAGPRPKSRGIFLHAVQKNTRASRRTLASPRRKSPGRKAGSHWKRGEVAAFNSLDWQPSCDNPSHRRCSRRTTFSSRRRWSPSTQTLSASRWTLNRCPQNLVISRMNGMPSSLSSASRVASRQGCAPRPTARGASERPGQDPRGQTSRTPVNADAAAEPVRGVPSMDGLYLSVLPGTCLGRRPGQVPFRLPIRTARSPLTEGRSPRNRFSRAKYHGCRAECAKADPIPGGSATLTPSLGLRLPRTGVANTAPLPDVASSVAT